MVGDSICQNPLALPEWEPQIVARSCLWTLVVICLGQRLSSWTRFLALRCWLALLSRRQSRGPNRLKDVDHGKSADKTAKTC